MAGWKGNNKTTPTISPAVPNSAKHTNLYPLPPVPAHTDPSESGTMRSPPSLPPSLPPLRSPPSLTLHAAVGRL